MILYVVSHQYPSPRNQSLCSEPFVGLVGVHTLADQLWFFPLDEGSELVVEVLICISV